MDYDDFLAGLHARVPRAAITLALVVLNLGIYVVIAFQAGSAWTWARRCCSPGAATKALIRWPASHGAC